MDLPEARGDRGVHPPDVEPPIISRRMRLTRERCSRGLASPPNAWVAVPFEQELGKTTLSDVAKGMSRSLRKSLKELPGSLATERELSEPGTRSEPET